MHWKLSELMQILETQYLKNKKIFMFLHMCRMKKSGFPDFSGLIPDPVKISVPDPVKISALRVPRAVTRLTVDRAFQVMLELQNSAVRSKFGFHLT